MEKSISTLLLLLAIAAPAAFAEDATQGFAIPKAVESVIANSCVECHGADESEGDVRFDNLSSLNIDARLQLLNKAQEQIFFGTMPPEDAEQPTTSQRTQLAEWVSLELNKHNASKLEDKLRKPEFGNYIDHEKLFSGEYKDLKAFTYDRRWLISEYIFEAKFNQLLKHQPFRTIDGTRHFVIGDNNRRVNLTNPFLLPTNSGVRYYANTTLNGGHLLTMITNAKESSTYMIYLVKRDQRFIPAINVIMNQQWEHERILASRESFLNSFIDKVLSDVYGEKNDDLLAKVVKKPTKLATENKELETQPEAQSETKTLTKRFIPPARDDYDAILAAMQKHKQDGDTDQQLIEKCENEWLNFEVHARKIQARVTFMNNWMSELHKRMPTKQLNRPYRALADPEMKIVTEAILKHRKKGDRYKQIIIKCMNAWDEEFELERSKTGPPNNETVNALVEQLFVKIFERLPTESEAEKYASLSKAYIEQIGNLKAIEQLIQTLILRTEFVYRYEFGQGEADAFGRKMLSPRGASYAIAYALTDSTPDKQLVEAAKTGKLNTKEDYQREVLRILNNREQYYVVDESLVKFRCDSISNTPIRKLRFFREFFGYPKLMSIFKDNKRFGANYDSARARLVDEADLLVDHILKNDKRVFEELLTTEKFYVYHSGNNEVMKTSADRVRKIYDKFKDEDWKNFKAEDLEKHQDFLLETKMRGIRTNDFKASLGPFKTAMTSFTVRFDKGQTAAAPFNSFPAHGMANAPSRTGLRFSDPQVAMFFNIKLDNWSYPTTQPAKVANRKGMLTHPAWLIAHAQNTETDPVIRGKWVREKLLAGSVPDVPITVDAVIPEDHHKTLRSRLVDVTEQKECWKCHERMNPLGYTFEIFDDFGRYRTQESLEHPDNLIKEAPAKGDVYTDLRDTYKTLPVNATGYLAGTGDENLDGEVTDAIELSERLGKSKRVRQSIIRYAFRYFMGRNEFLSDSKTLIDADQAYIESGGSFDAAIVSLLTSDSFMYRRSIKD